MLADASNLTVRHTGQTVEFIVSGEIALTVDVTSVDLIDLIRNATR